MNKKYELVEKKRNKDRIVDSVKNDVRKYIKREKNKPLTEGVDFWKMECKISKDENELVYVEFNNLIKTIDILVKEDAKAINIEILSTVGIQKVREIIQKEEVVSDEDNSDTNEEEIDEVEVEEEK